MNPTLRNCPGRLGALRGLSGRLAFTAGRRLTAPVVLLLLVAALIAPLTTPSSAGATTCPPGMVPGPDIEKLSNCCTAGDMSPDCTARSFRCI